MTRRNPLPAWTGVLCAGGLAALLLTVLWRGLADPAPAYGQIPDSGKQRDVMIKEMQTQTAHLAEIAGLLREIRDRQPPAAGKPVKAGGE